MHRRKLPIGIQTFAKIRGEDFYYVDKTDFIRQLIDEGSQYFLALWDLSRDHVWYNIYKLHELTKNRRMSSKRVTSHSSKR